LRRYALAVDNAIAGDWTGVDRAYQELLEDRGWCAAYAAGTGWPELVDDAVALISKLSAAMRPHEDKPDANFSTGDLTAVAAE
jgi:hypothetical protein